MKRAVLALVIVFAILLTACSYRYVGCDGLDERRIIVPLGKDYVWTDMSRYCYSIGGSPEKVAELCRDEPVDYEEYVCTIPGLPEEIWVYQVKDFQGWFECPFIFVREDYDMPAFDSADRIGNIFLVDTEVEIGVDALKKYGKAITGDIGEFIRELNSYRKEYDADSNWYQRDIGVEVLDYYGELYYQFTDLGEMQFRQYIYTTDDPDMYFIDYSIDETFCSIVFPKELLEEYFPIAS